MPLVNLVLGLAALLLGRKLFWLFVGAAGFVLGFNVAQSYFQLEAAWLVVVIGLVVGALGALLAVFAQRLAIAIAGFISGGYLLGQFAAYLGLAAAGDPASPFNPVIVITGGVIGAVLVSLFFDAALIVLSSILGATMTMQAVTALLALDPALRLLLYFVLVLVGIGLQWAMWRDRGGRRDNS
jgi:hypothetical protein